MRFDLASPSDDAQLRRLLRESPMEGKIRIALAREPNSFLAATIEGDIHQVIVAREDRTGRILGMGSRSVLGAYVNGEPTRLGYLSQLRVDPGHRGSPRMLLRGYAKLRVLHQDGLVPFYVTTIIEDNYPARRILEAGLVGMPAYRPVDRIVTLILPVRSRRSRRLAHDSPDRGVTITRGAADCLDDVVECLQRTAQRHQFAPWWTSSRLLSDDRTRGLCLDDFYVARRDGAIVGCLARWDQRSFKQSVVIGYRGWLGLLRPLLHRATALLPPPGETLRGAFISHVAVDDDDPGVLIGLLAAASEDAAAVPLDHLMIGFSDRSPLLAAVRRAYPHREYPSILYVVHWDDGADAVRRLDGRPSHLETAIL